MRGWRPGIAAAALAAGLACATPGEWRTYPPHLDVPVELALHLTLSGLEDHLRSAGVEIVCFGRRSVIRTRPEDEPFVLWQRRMAGRLRDAPFPVVDGAACGGLGGRYVMRGNDTPAAILIASPIDEEADGGAQRPFRTGISVLVDRRPDAGRFQIAYEFSRTPEGWWIDGIFCQGPRKPCDRVRTTMPVGATPALPDTTTGAPGVVDRSAGAVGCFRSSRSPTGGGFAPHRSRIA